MIGLEDTTKTVFHKTFYIIKLFSLYRPCSDVIVRHYISEVSGSIPVFFDVNM